MPGALPASRASRLCGGTHILLAPRGKLGTLLFLPYEGQDVPEFDAAVWSSPIGEVSAVTTSFGVHLLRVDARGSPE